MAASKKPGKPGGRNPNLKPGDKGTETWTTPIWQPLNPKNPTVYPTKKNK